MDVYGVRLPLTVFGQPFTVYLMIVISLLNKKGGAGKSTTAIGLAAGLRQRGLRIGLIDCDPNGSASRWLETVAEIDTVPCHPSQLGDLLAGIADDYDMVVVDSPPNDTDAIGRIAQLSDLVLIPLAPTAIEVDQLGDTLALIDAHSTPWTVVPVRVRLSTSAGQTIRELCAQQGISVTRSVVPLSEAVARSFGAKPPPLSYSALVDEILGRVEVPA